MITLVACGHTLGSVHSVDHPEIVSGTPSAGNIAQFDTTAGTFDSAVVIEYLNNTTKNPLVTNANITLNSDARIFSSDGNATVAKLKDQEVYKAECEDVFERMLDLVPASVTLSEPLQPIDIKPYITTHQLQGNASISFVGRIRIRTTTTPPIDPNSIAVTLIPTSRAGIRSNQSISTTKGKFKGGSSFGYLGESFHWFEFSTILDASTGISAFDVVFTNLDSGVVTTFDNGGSGGYKVNPYILYQQKNSCLETQNPDGKLTVVAAIHHSQLQSNKTPTLKLVHRVPLPRSFMSKFEVENVVLQRVEGGGGEFDYYKVETPLEVSSWRTSFDIEVGEQRLDYQLTSLLLGQSCTALV